MFLVEELSLKGIYIEEWQFWISDNRSGQTTHFR